VRISPRPTRGGNINTRLSPAGCLFNNHYIWRQPKDISLGKNLQFKSPIKRIDLQHHFIHEKQEEGLANIRSAEQVADDLKLCHRAPFNAYTALGLETLMTRAN